MRKILIIWTLIISTTFTGCHLFALTVTDYYADSNYTPGVFSQMRAGAITFDAQSFLSSKKGLLYSAKFYLAKNGSPTGDITAVLYSHAETYGTTSVATGTALATSVARDIGTDITTAFKLVTFDFIGANRIEISSGTHYVVAVNFEGGDDSNYLLVGADNTSPTHGGNRAYSLDGVSWTAVAEQDIPFYVYLYTVKKIGESDFFWFPWKFRQ